MIKMVIFDLDDTLFPEELFVKGGFKAVSKYVEENYGISRGDFFKELLLVFKRDGHGKVFDYALKRYALYDRKLVKILIDIYHRHKPSLSLYPGVYKILRLLRKKYKLAIITDGTGMVQRKKVKILGLDIFFDSIIYTYDYGDKRAKPHPYVFRKVLRHFNIKAEEAVYIGNDPHKDFVGPKSIGIRTIRIVQGRLKNLRTVKRKEAEYQIRVITDVPRVLDVL